MQMQRIKQPFCQYFGPCPDFQWISVQHRLFHIKPNNITIFGLGGWFALMLFLIFFKTLVSDILGPNFWCFASDQAQGFQSKLQKSFTVFFFGRKTCLESSWRAGHPAQAVTSIVPCCCLLLARCEIGNAKQTF